MKKLLVQKIVPVFLSVALVVPCFLVPAKAALAEALTVLSVIGDVTAVMEFADSVRDFFSGKTMAQESDWHMDSYLASGMADELDYYFRQESLEDLAEDWNVKYTQYSNGFRADVGSLGDTGYGCVRLVPSDGDYMGYRVLCTADHTPILSENYEYGAGRVDGSLPDKWVDANHVASMPSTSRDMKSLEELSNKARDNNGVILTIGDYYVVYNKARDRILANPSGVLYSAFRDPEKWASGSPRGDDSGVTVNGEEVEVIEGNQTNINLEDMTLTLPDGSINFIDQIIYDESTKTYHIDARDQSDTTINNYYTWNYHINYTSITYIGQTEEYNKYYEVYYELPDGRSSADLTKEDLEQLNVSVDVLPYTRAVDDVSLKSLYHFDGDTRDSSYWNYKTDFTWNSGASVTYMDAAAFEGALYLDETAHDFTFTLPCFVGSEFTMQWRYYQSATPAPVTDSYLRFGGTTVLQFNGSQILTGSGVPVCVVPVGSWNEICLTGHGTSMYVYLNGVKVATYPSTGFHSNKVNFHFGSEQQTFKYFDEFRFLSKDLYGAGTSYTPTAVPHDTNLTLVLPDSENIVADEWFEWVGGADTTLVLDFTSGDAMDMRWLDFMEDGRNFDVTFEMTEQGLVITRTDDSTGQVSSGAAGLRLDLSNLLPAQNCYHNTNLWFDGHTGKTATYVYAALADGGSSVTVRDASNSVYGWRATSDGENTSGYDAILYPVGKSICISRIEMAYSPGGSYASRFFERVKHSTLSAIDSSSMHVPSLAVRTDLQITDYQIGGVRPSVPTKGLVWALVENQRITSIQIYNGQAWESCDGRIWTGERWIPASSYNIVTLQDMYDIVDSTPDYEYIYTESGFWSWWQKSWNAFTEKFFNSVGSGGSSGMVPGNVQQSASSALSSLIEGIFGVIIEVLKSLIGAAQDLLSGIFGFLTDTVFGGVKDFFSSFDELISPFQSTVENEDGTTTTTTGLPEGVVVVFSFFSGLVLVMPDELRMILMFGFGLLLLLGVFKLVKA